ncbi:MADS-box transcription factor 27-like isoform X1 [Carex rostrata]
MMNRQFMGDELSGLSVKELQTLENQLEMSMRSVRTKKDSILIDEIQELNQKGGLLHQENVDLYRKANLVRQENIDLYKKLYEMGGSGALRENSNPTVPNDESVPVHLELSTPKQTGGTAPNLGTAFSLQLKLDQASTALRQL